MLTVKPKSHPNWQLHSASKTVCGTQHNHIEDYVLNEDSAGIFAVADGIGGYQGGAEASEFLCAVMTQELLEAVLGWDEEDNSLNLQPDNHG